MMSTDESYKVRLVEEWRRKVEFFVDRSINELTATRPLTHTEESHFRKLFSVFWTDMIERIVHLAEASSHLKKQMDCLMSEIAQYGPDAPMNDQGEVQHLGSRVDQLVGEITASKSQIEKLTELMPLQPTQKTTNLKRVQSLRSH